MLSDERIRELSCVYMEGDVDRECERAIRLAVAETAESCKADLAAANEAREKAERERDAWKDDAERYCSNADHHRGNAETLAQAVGLATTCVPSMEIDPNDPIGMMQRVCAEVERLREDAERWRVLRRLMEPAKGGASLVVNEEFSYYEKPDQGKEVALQWYPDTPIGFYKIEGSTLNEVADAAIDAARKG